MKIIVITKPIFFDNEASKIVSLLEEGCSYVHIRKPNASKEDVAFLLLAVPEMYHSRLVLHYYKDLLFSFPLLNYHHSMSSEFDSQIKSHQSKSMHHLSELKTGAVYNYQFISPVFDSISKEGYLSSIEIEELEREIKTHELENIIALGGISLVNVDKLLS